MNAFRCPDLDQLASSLVEAYRKADDGDIFCIRDGADSEIAQIHKMMADHRSSCQVCASISRREKIEHLQRQLHKQH
jgi:FMN-dependent NADH-azoreductase